MSSSYRIEQPCKDRGTVEAGPTQPIKRAVVSDQSGRTAIANDCVVLNWRKGHVLSVELGQAVIPPADLPGHEQRIGVGKFACDRRLGTTKSWMHSRRHFHSQEANDFGANLILISRTADICGAGAEPTLRLISTGYSSSDYIVFLVQV